MEMKRGIYPYRNSNVSYTKKLFENIPKACGKLVAISNGGYVTGNGTKMRPHFGYRVYWDSRGGQFNCQVYSQVREIASGEKMKEYSVVQGKDTNLETIINAILYNEYRVRNLLSRND